MLTMPHRDHEAAFPGRHACKVCGGPSPLLGVVDFNKSCEEQRRKFLPLSGIPIYYRRCDVCGFVFTDSLDGWSHDDFRQHIYNEEYLAVDPDYAGSRSASNAQIVGGLFEASAGQLAVVDYGGGAGALAHSLVQDFGFKSAVTYDPFVEGHARLPEGKADLVTSFETMEHSPDPEATVREMAGLVSQNGLVLFSTLLLPEGQFSRNDLMGWWYIGPRNGHVSIFSREALARIWRRFGFLCGSFNGSLHVAYRVLPSWAEHLAARPA